MPIGLGIGIGISIGGVGRSGEAVPRIQLSGLSIAEDAAGGTVLGDLSVANSPPGVSWTYAFKAGSNAAGLWQIINGNQVALADEASLDYEDTSSYPNEFIEATSDEMTPTVIERAFTFSVTNVIEAPVNVTPPAVTGSVEVGSTLSCSTGTWTDMGAGSYAYQWYIDGETPSAIEGATSNTLLLTHALIDEELYCEVTATNSADSTAEDSNTVGPVVDTTAPVLSGASASGTGYTTGSASVSTNEGNGTLYIVVTASATAPSAAQIKAGDDHTDADALFADDASVSSAGAQDAFSITGLAHTTTYYAHFMHEDAEGNQSDVVTAAFETDAATVPAAFEVGDWSIAAGDEEADVTISSLPDDGGDTITDIEYRVGSGDPVSSETDDTTGFTIPGLTNDVAVSVQVRAVNSVGAGAWSDVKAVTPEGDEEPAWSPLDLGADLMMWLPLDDPAELWQASDGTTAVSADNDPIGRAVDQSANARHANQSTSGARPRFRTGTPNYAEFGPDDYLVAGNDYDSTAFGFAAKVYRSGSQANGAPIFDFWQISTTGRVIFQDNKIALQWTTSAGANMFNIDTFFVQDPNVLPDTTWVDVAVNVSGTKGEVWINGSLVRSQTISAVTPRNPNTSSVPLNIGKKGDSATYFVGRLRNLVVASRNLTEDEITKLAAMT